jgi:hypothetical protein
MVTVSGVEYYVEPVHQMSLQTCWYATLRMLVGYYEKKLRKKWGSFYTTQKESGALPGGLIDTSEFTALVLKDGGKTLKRYEIDGLIQQHNLGLCRIEMKAESLLNALKLYGPLMHMSGSSGAVGHCVVISGIRIDQMEPLKGRSSRILKGELTGSKPAKMTAKIRVGYVDPLGASRLHLSWDGFFKKFPPFSKVTQASFHAIYISPNQFRILD